MTTMTTMTTTRSSTPLRSAASSSSCISIDGSTSRKKTTTATSSQDQEQRRCGRTALLRMAFMASLVTTAAVCATLSYVIISDLQLTVAEETYESIASRALQGAQSTTGLKLQGASMMGSIMSFAFPNADQWPFVALRGYTELNKQLGEMSLSAEHGLIHVVDPARTNVTEYEAFMQAYYRDNGFEDHVGYSDFGFGVWKNSANSTYEDGRVPDRTGDTTGAYESNYTVLTPLVEVAHKKSTNLMFNSHSDEARGTDLDSIFDCVENQVAQNASVVEPKCTLVTDMIKSLLHLKGPAGVIYTPIYPKNDPRTVVGFIGTVIFFEQVLNDIVPDYVDGLTLSISTHSETVTFKMEQGKPVLLGPGDLHDPSYDKYARSIVLNDVETQSRANAQYVLTVYPTATMFNKFQQNKIPWAVALGFVGAIAICTVLFTIYDYLMRHQAHERKQMLKFKRRFVRFISHEIRTPLNTVCMGMDLLEDELASKQQEKHTQPNSDQVNKSTSSKASATAANDEDISYWHELVQDVKENAHCAVSILNDLLSYDKIESGRLHLELDTVPIKDLITKVVSQFKLHALNSRVKLSAEFETDDIESGNDWRVVGDEPKLAQVVRNLLSNGLKFSPPGGSVTLTVSHVPNGLSNAATPKLAASHGGDDEETPCLERDGSILISCEDTGIGLSKEQLQQLFIEGVQFDAKKNQNGGGSGFGLAIALGIIEQHGGTITANSQGQGTGTTFIVELPMYRACTKGRLVKSVTCPVDSNTDELEEKAPPLETAVPPAKAPVPQKRRVLVVDDSRPNRKMLVRLLERSGHTCVSAENGSEAVKTMRQDIEAASTNVDHVAIDTILMDYEMPVMNGPKACRQIREMGCEDVLIFGVTGNVLDEDIEFFKSQGADTVMAKPVSMDDLNERWSMFADPGV